MLVGIRTLPADVALSFTGFLQDKLVIVTDTYSLIGSIFHFALSSNVRRGYLEFYGIRTSEVEMFVSATANA
ncbi:hypothetical protein AAVH_21096 [Aphelenchoides avenae]|nr:hypothetical protein AAVH_21096 [Aphelenchus avenae]